MAHRFIILTQARCGSELLANLVDGHPQVTCHAELFSHVTGHPERFNSFLDRVPQKYDRNDPATAVALAKIYLDTVFDEDRQYVGFKLLVEQIDQHPYLPSLLFGQSEEPIKVIRLIRKNELKVLLSRVGAKQRNLWHTTERVARQAIEMPTGEELLAELAAIRQANKRILETAPGNPGLVVAYEDFQYEKRNTLKAIQNFLGVPEVQVQSPMRKITSDSLAEAIANYDQVRQTLMGTEFANCHEDQCVQGAPRQPLISFVHIPKTGGTSLETLFNKNYDREEILMAYGPHDGPVEQYQSLPESRKQKLKVVTGHYTIGQSLTSLPPDTKHITIMRHPVDRLLSSYYMYYHHKNHPEGIRIRANNITLAQFADPAYGFGVDNVQTKYLCGLPPHMLCTPQHLELALNILTNKIAVCGILEHFKETVFLCSKLFGWKDIEFTHVGYNSKRPKREALSPDDRAVVLRHNLYDMELYSRGLELFEQSLRAIGSYRDELDAYLDTKQQVRHARHYHPWRNDDGTLKEKR